LCRNVVVAVNRLMTFIDLPNYIASQPKMPTTCSRVLFVKPTVLQLRYRKKQYIQPKGFYYVYGRLVYNMCQSNGYIFR
jgi:hypothetical protein